MAESKIDLNVCLFLILTMGSGHLFDGHWKEFFFLFNLLEGSFDRFHGNAPGIISHVVDCQAEVTEIVGGKFEGVDLEVLPFRAHVKKPHIFRDGLPVLGIMAPLQESSATIILTGKAYLNEVLFNRLTKIDNNP